MAGETITHLARISSLRGQALAIVFLPLRPIGWEGEGWGEVGQFPASPSRRLRSCLTPSIGTLPPHRWPDSSLSARSIRCRTPLHRLRGMLSLIPTAANCRDRQRQRCAQRFQRPRCSAYRPRPAIWPRDFVRPKTSALRREAPPVAEDVAVTVRSAISAPPPFRKLHCSGQKQPNSLVKPILSDTSPAGCGQVGRARPCCHRVAAHALRSAVVESDNLAGAGATAPGNATRRMVAGFAAALA